MTKIQIELPDATAKAAKAAGLLTSQALAGLLSSALNRLQAGNYLLNVADDVAALGEPPLSMDEINAEVKAARKARQHVADSH